MSDWQPLERRLVDFFRVHGYRPKVVCGDQRNTPFQGDWIVQHGNKPINLSVMARELSEDLTVTS